MSNSVSAERGEAADNALYVEGDDISQEQIVENEKEVGHGYYIFSVPMKPCKQANHNDNNHTLTTASWPAFKQHSLTAPIPSVPSHPFPSRPPKSKKRPLETHHNANLTPPILEDDHRVLKAPRLHQNQEPTERQNFNDWLASNLIEVIRTYLRDRAACLTAANPARRQGAKDNMKRRMKELREELDTYYGGRTIHSQRVVETPGLLDVMTDLVKATDATGRPSEQKLADTTKAILKTWQTRYPELFGSNSRHADY